MFMSRAYYKRHRVLYLRAVEGEYIVVSNYKIIDWYSDVLVRAPFDPCGSGIGNRN